MKKSCFKFIKEVKKISTFFEGQVIPVPLPGSAPVGLKIRIQIVARHDGQLHVKEVLSGHTIFLKGKTYFFGQTSASADQSLSFYWP